MNGMRILSHIRGNPETRVRRNLPIVEASSCIQLGRQHRLFQGLPMTHWESDQLVVLRERESRSHGEGVDKIRSQQRKHCPDMKGWK